MPYPTPDTLPTTFRCRRLRIPDDVLWLEIVNGALVELIKDYNFEAVGDVTPEEAAQVFQDMFFEYLKGEPCLLGAILPYATETAPEGTLPCDGSSYLRVDYPALYGALSAVYITDADNFTTPDLQGRAIIGTGAGLDLTARVIGDFDGTETHTLIVEEIPSHDHTTTPHQHFYDKPVLNLDLEAPGAPDILGLGQPFIPTLTSAEGVTVNPTGDDSSHNNMQPFHALRYCIVSR